MDALAGLPLPEGELALDAGSEIVGRARVHQGTLAGRAVAAWVFAVTEEARVRRLVALGRDGLGGFVAAGRRAGEIVAICNQPQRTVADLAAAERWPAERALALVERLTGALLVAEEGALFPGPLRPADVALDDGGAFLTAPSLVRTLAGDVGGATHGTGPSPRWTPPEQVAGAPWDAAANRYVLGLVAYRLLAGEHPFSGAGLRHAIEAQGREAPPFDDEIARALRPGVQAFVLGLLRPRAADRPKSALAIREQLRALREGAPAPAAAKHRAARPPAAPSTATPAAATPATAASTASRPSPRQSSVRASMSLRTTRLVAVLVSAVVAALAWALTPSAAPKQPRALVPERGPVTSRSAEACAPCHARQVEEWNRSVMAFSSRSPLYRALESAVEEQVGRDDRCPGGAGVLRKRGAGACVDPASNVSLTGSGGEHWCVHCHAPLDQLSSRVPPWNGTDVVGRGARPPLGEVLSREGQEGISCVACHATIGPVDAHARSARSARNGRNGGVAYEGNPTWTSARSGIEFAMRPEDARGVFGISNSGYRLEPSSFFATRVHDTGPMVHERPSAETRAYLGSSEFCGACHDVRLFGTDVIGARDRGEHFKRLRNAYSEWRSWADGEARAGRRAATCQECHMSTFPGVCQTGAPRRGLESQGCPPGTGFVARAPGQFGAGPSHYFTGVEIPFASEFPEALASDRTIDADGVPLGIRARRDMLLRSAFSFDLGRARVDGGALEVPLEITNVGAGHRVPAGFSQEREFWVELRVTDARGGVVYEVGRVDRADQDLGDKRFVRVRTDDVSGRDGRGRPLGVFGADVTDGPDVPRWSPDPSRGGTIFRGLGLVNFQNGFLRCVRCIGVIAPDGSCQPGPGQGATRADRFDDGDYDPDTGECRSNLGGGHELFETYYPIGALDADRGVLRAPDAIIDTRSAPPGVPLRYTYVIPGASNRPRPLRVEARLRFRAFPPFLLRAFAEYERERASRGERPSGPQITERVLERLEIVDLARAEAEVP